MKPFPEPTAVSARPCRSCAEGRVHMLAHRHAPIGCGAASASTAGGEAQQPAYELPSPTWTATGSADSAIELNTQQEPVFPVPPHSKLREAPAVRCQAHPYYCESCIAACWGWLGPKPGALAAAACTCQTAPQQSDDDDDSKFQDLLDSRHSSAKLDIRRPATPATTAACGGRGCSTIAAL